MKTSIEPFSPWQPDTRFWVGHLYVPLLAAVTILILLEYTPLDLWLADHWYAFEGGEWSLKRHWFTYGVIHYHGKQLIISIALALVALLIMSTHFPRLRRWRRPMGYLLTCMVVLPGAVALLKYFSTVPCSWDLARYGGEMTYQHNFAYLMASGTGGPQ